MTLPALANVVAIRDAVPERLEGARRRLSRLKELSFVMEPAPDWLVAIGELPHGPPPDAAALKAGLIVAEGRDRLTHARGRAWYVHVIDLIERRPRDLGELPGDFAVLHVDPDGEATVVSSCAGIVPWYRLERGGRLMLATRLEYFPTLLDEELELDPLVTAQWACGVLGFPDGRTFIRGVSRLERGSALRIRRAGATPAFAYWHPEVQARTPRSLPELAEAMRGILVARLEADLSPRAGNLLTLSGGVDSGALAYLATSVAGRPLASLSLLPSHPQGEPFERRQIAAIVEQCAIDPAHEFKLSYEELANLVGAAPATPFPVLHPALLLLERLRERHQIDVLVGGEFADEICGHEQTIGDWANGTSPWRLLRRPPSLPFGPRDYARWIKHRTATARRRAVLPLPAVLPGWVAQEVRAEYAEWRSRFAATISATEPRWRAQLTARLAISSWVEMNWEAASRLGVRRSLPFFNREALDLGFACHPTQLIGPGVKRLLRSALAADVPDFVLGRPDKGHWGMTEAGRRASLTGDLSRTLEGVLAAPFVAHLSDPIPFHEACGIFAASQAAQSLRPGGMNRLQLRLADP